MTHQPKGSMCISCGNANASCASRPFASMPVIKAYPDGVKAVKCTGHVHAQASTEKNEALQQVLVAALEEARSAINSMKVEAETAGQGDEQMMLEACETISNEGLQADMAIRAALASAPKPSSTPQADSQPAPVAQGDAQQRAMDARHAAIYRWIIQHIDKAASIIDAWREDGEADKDELHDALAARAAKEGTKHG